MQQSHDRTLTSVRAWSTFWREQGPQSRCLSGASPDIGQALSGHWQGFAGSLRESARVVDLGCGTGIVGRLLSGARPDLHIVGVDSADLPAQENRGVTLVSATAMESLPFDDGSFDAAVSQFGFEYGRVDQTSKELFRVLVPGASISFLVHHSESPIVSAGRDRRRVLIELTGAEPQEMFLSGNVSSFAGRMMAVKRRHPNDPLGQQVAHQLENLVRRGPTERKAIWQAVTQALGPELIMLADLEASCVSADALQTWIAPLTEGFDLARPTVLKGLSDRPIAWRIEGARRG